MKSDNIFIKLIISLLIIITLFNFISATDIKMNCSFATTDVPTEEVEDITEDQTNGIGNILYSGVRLIFVKLAQALRSINYAVASAAGVKGDFEKNEITPFDIFFNKFTLLDINIFSTDGINSDGLVYKMRTIARDWYFAVKEISLVLVGIVLLWNLIKAVSKSTSIDQKAQAKNVLLDWLVSLCLIALMHFIIILLVNFNDIFLSFLERLTPLSDSGDFLDALENVIFSQNMTLGIAALIVYAVLNYQTFVYICMYIMRLLKFGFLVVISTVTPITYSISKSKGKSQTSFDIWLKQITYLIFLQSFHAFIYCVLISFGMTAMVQIGEISTTEDLGVAIIAVATLFVIPQAEKILKKICGFDDQDIYNTVIFSSSNSTGILPNPMNAIRRVATGGPLISFGKNVDGSDIGIGQVADGIRNNARRAIDRVTGNSRNFVETTGQAIRERTQNTDNRVETRDNDLSQASGVAGEASRQTNRQSRERNADRDSMTANERLAAVVVEVGRDSNDNTNRENNNDDATDREDDKEETLEVLDSTENNESQETNSNSSRETENVSDDESQENNVTRIYNNTTETITEPTKIEHEDKDEEDSIKDINIPIKEGMDPKLLEEFKNILKAVLEKDSDKIKVLLDDIHLKIASFKGKIDDKDANKIINKIQDNWNDKEKLQKYINSLKEGSVERDFAETMVQYRTLYEMSDEDDSSTNTKIKELLKSYQARGLDVSNSAVNEAVKNFTSLNPVQKSEEVVETTETNRETTENTVEVQPESEAIRKGKLINLPARHAKALYELGIKFDDKFDLETDFQLRLDEMSKEMKTENPSLDDIINGMSPKDRKTYDEYRKNPSNASQLTENAKKVAVLQMEAEAIAVKSLKETARRNGFETNFDEASTTTNIETSIDGRNTKVTGTLRSSTQSVVKDLERSRRNRRNSGTGANNVG